MSESSRKTALVIGAVAAAAGIAVFSGILIRRARANGMVGARTVADVLNDCYTRIRDIQQHLTEISAGAPQPANP